MNLQANIQWQHDAPAPADAGGLRDRARPPAQEGVSECVPECLKLRPATAQDLSFQRKLYHERRQGELAHVPWSVAEKQAFCDLQFMLQRADWGQRYPQARQWLLCRDADGIAGEPVGLLIWVREPDCLRVVDIALEPAWRGRGWGTRLLQGLMQEANGAPLRLCVERANPALNLYRRLGFVTEDESDALRLQLVWRAPAVSAPASAVNFPDESAAKNSQPQETVYQSSRE
jgi:ribosomal protein S18 acetylase RimI-like enzyme